MYTKRPSDESWIKFLLATGLLTIEKLQAMAGNQNQVDVTELLTKHAAEFENDAWLNVALQRDRFHYVPLRENVDPNEINAFCEQFPLLYNRCLHEGILPLGYNHQIIYFGVLRYDDSFEELQDVLKNMPPDVLVCISPLAPIDFVRIAMQLRSLAQP